MAKLIPIDKSKCRAIIRNVPCYMCGGKNDILIETVDGVVIDAKAKSKRIPIKLQNDKKILKLISAVKEFTTHVNDEDANIPDEYFDDYLILLRAYHNLGKLKR
jgi:hypothetical protein